MQKIREQEKKLQEIYASVRRMERYFLWTFIITVVVLVLPLIGLVFVIPMFLNSLNFKALGL